MPHTSKTTSPESANAAGYAGRFGELDGYTVAFEEFTAGGDMAPLFRGLPDDRCQASHWGVVISGRLTFTYSDRTDVIEAGDAYYAPPGHTPAAEPGTETIEFSPTDELHKTMAVVMKNAQTLDSKA